MKKWENDEVAFIAGWASRGPLERLEAWAGYMTAAGLPEPDPATITRWIVALRAVIPDDADARVPPSSSIIRGQESD
jgi:hypothetical protein